MLSILMESIDKIPPIILVNLRGWQYLPALITPLAERSRTVTLFILLFAYSKVSLLIVGLDSKTAYTLSAVIDFSPASVPKIKGVYNAS